MSRRLQDAADELANYRARRDQPRQSDRDRDPALFSLSGTPAEISTVTDAIERVTAHAGEAWRDQALCAIEHIAQRQDTLIADDIWQHLEARGEALVYDRRALGGVLREAARRGWITSTQEYAPSARRHASPLRVWRSLLRGEGTP